MNIDDNIAFLAFAESLNFTQAAEKLSISQPALHVKINKLGTAVGAPLYRKSGRHLTLTVQGEEFARYCREVIAAHQAFLQRVHGEEHAESVTLAAGSGAYLYLLGEGIRRFGLQKTGSLHLLTGDRDQCLQYLRSGRAQLAVTVLTHTPADIRARLLCPLPTVLVVPKDHKLARRRRLTIKDLNDLNLIVPPTGKPFRETLELYLRQHKVDWTVALEAQGWDLMLHFVDLGLGSALVNGCCRIPKTCRAIPVSGLPSVEYFVIRLKEARQSTTSRSLEKCLFEEIRSPLRTEPDASP